MTDAGFERELTALLPRLRRFAHALSRNVDDADDLAQLTVERALRSAVQFEAGTRMDAWLFRIMRNIWIDTIRARRRTDGPLRPEEEGLSVGEDPRPQIEARLELTRVMRAVQTLPEEQREAVALVLVDGLGYREAAEVLEVPIGTLSSRLARGRMALLAALGGGTGDDR